MATYTLIPTSSHTPVKITLAYYDYPASSATTSRALVNNIDLTASHMGLNYSANGASSPSAVVNTRNNLEQIVIRDPTVGQPVVVRVAGTSVVRGPQPYAIAITGQFRKDATLFPQAVPRVDAFATDGTEVRVRLFVFMRALIWRACTRPPLNNTRHDTAPTPTQALVAGANFPRSSAVALAFTLACLSDPSLTPNMTAEPTAFSAAAQFVALRLSPGTTRCARFSLQISSDGFIGDPVMCVRLVSSCHVCEGLCGCRREGGIEENAAAVADESLIPDTFSSFAHAPTAWNMGT